MLKVKREGVILKPTKHAFEAKGVFNPGVMQVGSDVHIFYRAWDKKDKSTFGYAKLKGPLKVVKRDKKPFMIGDKRWQFSIEDPRITKIADTYYMTYTGYDGVRNVRMHYATSKDLINWDRKGSFSPEISYDKAEDIFRACKKKLKERYFLLNLILKIMEEKMLFYGQKIIAYFQKK
jgi:beta-1,2-mannobiose phosphorylase / 1,2-beta-oligomannan phosphorylase